jgi:hypothetical protein
MYILRSPAHTISQSLYLPDNPNVVVLGINSTVRTVVPLQPAEVLQPGKTLHFKIGEKLTYEQLFDVIIEEEKVITL